MGTFLISKKINYDKETQIVKNRVDDAISIIRNHMQKNGFIEVQKNTNVPKIDFVFSLGGDGTMLHSLHNYVEKEPIVIGINAGKLGFLTPYSLEDVKNETLFNDIQSGNFRIEERAILSHEVKNVLKGYAVNDYAFTAEGPNDILECYISVDNKGVSSEVGLYRANALVISGPCGSTAYNMNAGGAIVDPSMRCMQITMVAPQTMGVRPMIFGETAKIKVKIKSPAKVWSDGILEYEAKNEPENFEILMLKKNASIMLPKNWNFFDILAKKLYWNNGKLY